MNAARRLEPRPEPVWQWGDSCGFCGLAVRWLDTSPASGVVWLHLVGGYVLTCRRCYVAFCRGEIGSPGMRARAGAHAPHESYDESAIVAAISEQLARVRPSSGFWTEPLGPAFASELAAAFERLDHVAHDGRQAALLGHQFGQQQSRIGDVEDSWVAIDELSLERGDVIENPACRSVVELGHEGVPSVGGVRAESAPLLVVDRRAGRRRARAAFASAFRRWFLRGRS